MERDLLGYEMNKGEWGGINKREEEKRKGKGLVPSAHEI